MKTLKKIKPHLIYKEYEATGTIRLPVPYNNDKKLFVHNMITLFSKITLCGNGKTDNKISMQATLRNISKEGVNGISFEDIRALILISSKIPRSKLVSSMVNNPKYGSLTPLFMYAHKLYNNVNYSSWDVNDPLIAVAIGTFLNNALDFQKAYPTIMSIDTTERIALLGSRKYIDYPTHLKHTYTADQTEDIAETIVYPKEWLVMNCQFWLANRELRDTDSMLLDIKNFGRIPKALDAAPAAIQEVPDEPLSPESCSWF